MLRRQEAEETYREGVGARERRASLSPLSPGPVTVSHPPNLHHQRQTPHNNNCPELSWGQPQKNPPRCMEKGERMHVMGRGEGGRQRMGKAAWGRHTQGRLAEGGGVTSG